MSQHAGRWNQIEQEARHVVQRHVEALIVRFDLHDQDRDDIAQELWAGIWEALNAEGIADLGPAWIECLVAAQAAAWACRHIRVLRDRSAAKELPQTQRIESGLGASDGLAALMRHQLLIDTRRILDALPEALRRQCQDRLTATLHGVSVPRQFSSEQLEVLRRAFRAAGFDPFH